MEKYDITKPIKIPVGMHRLNSDPSISFQLNRLVNIDGCDLAVAKEIGNTIKSADDFYTVLKKRGDFELENGHIKKCSGTLPNVRIFHRLGGPERSCRLEKGKGAFL